MLRGREIGVHAPLIRGNFFARFTMMLQSQKNRTQVGFERPSHPSPSQQEEYKPWPGLKHVRVDAYRHTATGFSSVLKIPRDQGALPTSRANEQLETLEV